LKKIPYPVAAYRFEKEGGSVISASGAAADLFGFRDLNGMLENSMERLLQQLLSRMVPRQREPFIKEQAGLLGEIDLGRKPVASVCLVFGDADIPAGSAISNAYLPLVTWFTVSKPGPKMLDVMYLDVKAQAKMDEHGVVRCQIG
jgi:hypothetical protein